MEHKKNRILESKRLENARILRVITHCCNSQRLLSIDMNKLSEEAHAEIGNRVVDLFLDCLHEHEKR